MKVPSGLKFKNSTFCPHSTLGIVYETLTNSDYFLYSINLWFL